MSLYYVCAFHRTVLPSPADRSATPEVPSVLEQLVTHVPDLIVYRSHDAPLPQTIHSYGVVMFGDISGSQSEIFGLINYKIFVYGFVTVITFVLVH